LIDKHRLEDNSLPSYDKNKSTLIRDGMGIIQSLNAKRYNTFGELAKDYFDNMVACFQHSSSPPLGFQNNQPGKFHFCLS
jgi:hypothetical protein